MVAFALRRPDGAPQPEAEALLQPYAGARRLTFHPVDRRLNDVRNDDEALVEPVELDAAEEEQAPADPKVGKGGQMSLF